MVELINNIEKNAEAEFLFFYGGVIKRIIKRFQENYFDRHNSSFGHQKFVALPNARLNQWASGKAGGFKELLWNLGFFFGLRFPIEFRSSILDIHVRKKKDLTDTR